MPIGTYQNHYTKFFSNFFHFRCILLQISHNKCFFISISILGRSGVNIYTRAYLKPVSLMVKGGLSYNT